MARRTGCFCIVLCLVAGAASAETIVNLDVAFASNAGTPMVYDHFTGGDLSAQWLVLGGNPGPESNSRLELRPGDLMLAGMRTDPNFNTIAIGALDLTEFTAGSLFSMFLTGGPPEGDAVSDRLVLSIVPGFAILTDETGLLGGIPIDLGPTATMALLINGATNRLGAVVNGQFVFLGENTLGTVTSVGFFVAPEPTAAGLLALGLSTVLVRRRRPR